jgi:predicted MPP superfamily phosphohydrolase
MNQARLQPINRRRFLKRGLMWLAAAAGLAVGGGGYSVLVERRWLMIRSLALTLPSLPNPFKGVKLVQFSDVHLGHYYEAQDLQKIAELILKQQPDVICFTGDLVDEDHEELAKVVPVLQKMEAPLGKFAVLGNHDYRAGAGRVVKALERGGFHVLRNSHVRVQRNGSSLYMAGVDDALYGDADLPRTLQGIPDQACTILLAHEPDVAVRAAAHPVALQLSGHSHGGQVRLPFWGHVLTPPLARKYVDGWHAVEESRPQVFVNRGLGTTILPIRFLCRPELTVITLN